MKAFLHLETNNLAYLKCNQSHPASNYLPTCHTYYAVRTFETTRLRRFDSSTNSGRVAQSVVADPLCNATHARRTLVAGQTQQVKSLSHLLPIIAAVSVKREAVGLASDGVGASATAAAAGRASGRPASVLAAAAASSGGGAVAVREGALKQREGGT